ncbi:carboxypeptidase-like regulatory domain-containing protein [uncultured Ferrimonas sp.]|uniref:carboxypeptidase-like regulatory domain-containing protein n=1 Tax=uncultured Ferrimonas sp. TaxID=432640 RepID=UPI00262CA081|nr:carboxypeptidase-like regulatory domain-containing protein [uncultured Ferrimonas sp.]
MRLFPAALLALLPLTALADDTVTISGKVTDRHGQPISQCDVIFNPSAFIGDDSLYFKCDENGRYRAEVPAGHYNSLYSLDLPQYAKTQLEFWGWNLTLTEDEVIDIAFDTIEVYSLNVWASNGGSNSVFAAFRPMHLAKALAPQYRRTTMQGNDIAVFDITPELDASQILAHIDGKPLQLLNYHWSYEQIGDCGQQAPAGINANEPCHMPMIIAQFKKPTLSPGKHQFRLRISDKRSGDIGEGLTHFVSNQVGLGF